MYATIATAKTIPVSLGRDTKPSFSGTMVIMERLDKTVFDSSTYGTPVNDKDGYRTDVQFAERLTWDGQFIHGAPWSVAQQGHSNVSHGCINLSPADAEWFYALTQRGDVIDVRNAGSPPNLADPGMADWNLSWDAWSR